MNVHSRRNSKYPILDDLTVPQITFEGWQKTADLMAELVNVPAALIMRVHRREIDVFVSSKSEGNVYEAGERAPLDSGLYCETVMDTRRELFVPGALKDPSWDHNPDIALGMVSYYGLPLTWPSGEIFNTFCILDTKENPYSNKYLELMRYLRDSIQLSIASIYENYLQTTEARQAREKIQTLSQAIEQSPVSVILTDIDVNIEYVNPATEIISGYPAKEIIGKKARIFQSGNTPLSIYNDLWKTIKSGKSWRGEVQNRKKSGELYYCKK